MPLYYTAAKSSQIRSSGIRKRNPVSAAKRAVKSKSKATEDVEFIQDSGLEAHAVVLAKIAPGLSSTSVPVILAHVPRNMFEEIPASMNSVRIAEILNYRRRMPPIVSTSHVHAIREAPTATEREIAELVREGRVCKIAIPGRGTGASALGNGLVLLSEWRRIVSTDLDEDLREKYLTKLQGISAPPFTGAELKTLTKAGFLTNLSLVSRTESFFTTNPLYMTTSLQSIAKAGSFASGSDGAAAMRAVENISGGSGAASRMQKHAEIEPSYSFSLPNTGIYLKLLAYSRDHLVSQVTKSGPSRSTTLERLREKWDGSGKVANRNRRWREFHGLKFEWVLAECLGAGMLECFKTGSVGTGVRVI
jgi:hypothetical protein